MNIDKFETKDYSFFQEVIAITKPVGGSAVLSELSEKLYINTVYDMMVHEGVEQVSIREIAKVLGVSSTSMYRYFDSLEHLMIYASLRWLRPYLKDLSDLGVEELNSPQGYFYMWERFSIYCYANPQIFNNIFFVKHSYSLEPIFKKYYSMFEEDLFSLDNIKRNYLMEDSLELRNMHALKNTMRSYNLSQHILDQTNKLHIYIFKGMFKDLLDGMPCPENYTDQLIKYLRSTSYFMHMY